MKCVNKTLTTESSLRIVGQGRTLCARQHGGDAEGDILCDIRGRQRHRGDW